jgi:hypothetical protein
VLNWLQIVVRTSRSSADLAFRKRLYDQALLRQVILIYPLHAVYDKLAFEIIVTVFARARTLCKNQPINCLGYLIYSAGEGNIPHQR